MILRDTHLALEKRMKELDKQKKETAIKIREAASHGDLKENGEYHAARERQSFIEGRITELEDVTSRAEVIDTSRISGETVTFGVTVVIVDELTDIEYNYSIVGPYEAELEEGKISTASPIAKGLIGKRVGESVEVQTPRGPHPYEIISISVYNG